MATQIFVNLPVKDLDRSVGFFSKLGYKFNPQFTDKNATCMIVGENIFAMLLVEPYFQTFTQKTIADAHKTAEMLIAVTLPTKGEVDRVCNAAFAAGGKRYSDAKDHGWMYQWGFEDPDGHTWEVVWADPKGPPQSS